MISKKQLFKRPSAEKILKDKEITTLVRSDELAYKIDELNENQVLVVMSNIIPQQYFPQTENPVMSYHRTEASRKFLKHAPEVKLRRQYSLEQMIRERKVPVELRKDAFDSINNPYNSCYSYMPIGKDERRRRVSLKDCVDAGKLYWYSENSNAKIELKNYGTREKAARVEKEGSTFVVSVPSRTQKKPRYQFKLMEVPTQDTMNKYAIWRTMFSDHACESLRYKIGYKFYDDKESSNVFNFDAHEIAAYLKIVESLWHNEKNIVPLQMSPFAIPTEDTIKFYEKARNNVVVCYLDKEGQPKYAPLNAAELEIALWSKVKKDGHDKTFYATKKLVDYKI